MGRMYTGLELLPPLLLLFVFVFEDFGGGGISQAGQGAQAPDLKELHRRLLLPSRFLQGPLQNQSSRPTSFFKVPPEPIELKSQHKMGGRSGSKDNTVKQKKWWAGWFVSVK